VAGLHTLQIHTVVKWLARMPSWAIWRPPLRWESSIEEKDSLVQL